ncbi:MAG: hypothetical protein PF483_13880 [Halothiobacillus sp.]|nr:hypothetical protein [Halothiobacillus sp.]
MKIHALVLAAFTTCAFGGAVILPAQAETQAHQATAESAQIVDLMPVLLHHEQSLKFTDDQKKFFAAWMKKYPPRRAEIEQDIVTMRTQLRALILDGGNHALRDSLVQQLGASHAQLLMMSALDVETIQEHVSKEQFKQLVALYRQQTK